VEVVHEFAEHAAAPWSSRQSSQCVSNHQRGLTNCPPADLVSGSIVLGVGELRRERCVRGRANRVRRHVSDRRRVPGRTSRRLCRRVANLSSRCVRLSGPPTSHADPVARLGEGSRALDRVTGSRIVRRPGFEQRQRPFSAIGRPRRQHPSIFLAQRQRPRLTPHRGACALRLGVLPGDTSRHAVQSTRAGRAGLRVSAHLHAEAVRVVVDAKRNRPPTRTFIPCSVQVNIRGVAPGNW